MWLRIAYSILSCFMHQVQFFILLKTFYEYHQLSETFSTLHANPYLEFISHSPVIAFIMFWGLNICYPSASVSRMRTS